MGRARLCRVGRGGLHHRHEGKSLLMDPSPLICTPEMGMEHPNRHSDKVPTGDL